MKVLLDTNFVLIPFQFKFNVFEKLKLEIPNCELIILEKQVDELKKVCEKEKLNFDSIFEWIKKRVKIIKFEEKKDVDELILDYCEIEGCYLATQDIKLKKEAIKRGIKIISASVNNKKLIFEGTTF